MQLQPDIFVVSKFDFPDAASDFPATKFRFRHPWNHKWIVKYLILNLGSLYLKLRDFNGFKCF